MCRKPSVSTLAAALLAALGTVPLAAQAATVTVNIINEAYGQGNSCSFFQAINTMSDGATPGTLEGTCRSTVTGTFGNNDTILFDTTVFPYGGTNVIQPFKSHVIKNANLVIDATANGNVTLSGITSSSQTLVDLAPAGSSLTLKHMTMDKSYTRLHSTPYSHCYRQDSSGRTNYYGGAAICSVSANVTLIDSKVTNGISQVGNTTGGGGGIFIAQGNITLINTTISGNRTLGQGGGISARFGNVTLINSTVSDNRAHMGGGIAADIGKVTLINSTVSGNQAGSSYRGGGISAGRSGVDMVNSTVSGNSAIAGAGIYAGGPVTLTNSTVSSNSATDGSGIYMLQKFSPVTAKNSIIAGNLLSGGSQPGGDLLGNLSAGSYGNLIGVIPNLNLGPLADNGGPTQTMLPQTGSPAIDAISCANAPPTDQRGMIRPDPGSTSITPCDIGAVEVGSISDEIFKDGFGN